MDTFEAILSRRSIRQYTNEVRSHEIIDKLLTAAMQAPSAKVGDPSKKKKN